MTLEEEKALWSRGYRPTPHAGLWAKPVGYCMVVYCTRSKVLACRFLGDDDESHTYSSVDLDPSDPVAFQESIADFEAYKLKPAANNVRRDMSFLTIDQFFPLRDKYEAL